MNTSTTAVTPLLAALLVCIQPANAVQFIPESGATRSVDKVGELPSITQDKILTEFAGRSDLNSDAAQRKFLETWSRYLNAVDIEIA